MFMGYQATFTTRAASSGEFVSRSGRIVAVAALLALAVPTGIVALAQGAGWLKLPYNLFVVDLRLPGIFRLHMLASGLALLLIPVAIHLARRRHRWHRIAGRAAAACVLLGALTSLPVAIWSDSNAYARIGFLAQGLTWLGLLVAGVLAVRERRLFDHMRFMLAMAAVASGAIWVRLTTTVVTTWDLPFDPLYACAAWGGWLVPLAIVWHAGPRLIARPSHAG